MNDRLIQEQMRRSGQLQNKKYSRQPNKQYYEDNYQNFAKRSSKPASVGSLANIPVGMLAGESALASAAYAPMRGISNANRINTMMRDKAYGVNSKVGRGLDMFSLASSAGWTIPMSAMLAGRALGFNTPNKMSSLFTNILGSKGIGGVTKSFVQNKVGVNSPEAQAAIATKIAKSLGLGGKATGMMTGALGGANSLIGGLGMMSPMMGFAALKMLTAVLKIRKLNQIRSKQQASGVLERKFSVSSSLDGYINSLISSKQLSPADQIQIQLLKWIEGHTSVLPQMLSEIDYKSQQKTKGIKFSSGEYNKHALGEDNRSGLDKIFDKTEHGLARITAKYDPITQLSNFIFGHKLPNSVLKDIDSAYGSNSLQASAKDNAKFLGLNYSMANLMTLTSRQLVDMGDSYEAKMMNLTRASFDVSRLATSELTTIRRVAFGIPTTSYVKSEKESGIFKDMLDGIRRMGKGLLNIPGVNAAYNMAKLPFTIGAKVGKFSNKVLQGLGSLGTGSLFANGRESLASPLFKLSEEDLERKAGTFKDINKKAQEFMAYGMPERLADLQYTLENIYSVESNMLYAQTGVKHKAKGHKLVWNQTVGKYLTPKEAQQQQLQDDLKKLTVLEEQFDKGFIRKAALRYKIMSDPLKTFFYKMKSYATWNPDQADQYRAKADYYGKRQDRERIEELTGYKFRNIINSRRGQSRLPGKFTSRKLQLQEKEEFNNVTGKAKMGAAKTIGGIGSVLALLGTLGLGGTAMGLSGGLALPLMSLLGVGLGAPMMKKMYSFSKGRFKDFIGLRTSERKKEKRRIRQKETGTQEALRREDEITGLQMQTGGHINPVDILRIELISRLDALVDRTGKGKPVLRTKIINKGQKYHPDDNLVFIKPFPKSQPTAYPKPQLVSARAAKGGVFGHNIVEVGEAGKKEAIVPLPDNRHIPVKILMDQSSHSRNVTMEMKEIAERKSKEEESDWRKRVLDALTGIKGNTKTSFFDKSKNTISKMWESLKSLGSALFSGISFLFSNLGPILAGALGLYSYFKNGSFTGAITDAIMALIGFKVAKKVGGKLLTGGLGLLGKGAGKLGGKLLEKLGLKSAEKAGAKIAGKAGVGLLEKLGLKGAGSNLLLRLGLKGSEKAGVKAAETVGVKSFGTLTGKALEKFGTKGTGKLLEKFGIKGAAKLGLKGAGRLLGPLGWIAMSGLDAYDGWKDAGEYFNTDNPTFGQKLSGALGNILTFGMAGESGSKFIYDIGHTASDAMQPVLNSISGVWKNIKDTADKYFDELPEPIKNGLKWIKGKSVEIWDSLMQWLKDKFGWLYESITGKKWSDRTDEKEKWNDAGINMPKSNPTGSSGFSWLGALTNPMKTASDIGWNAGTRTGKAIKEYASKAASSVSSTYSAAKEYVKQKITGSGESTPYTGKISTNNSTEKIQSAMAYFQSQGLTREQAAGLVGNLQHESSLRTDVIGDKNLKETAFGIGQWRADRRVGLEKYAKSIGKSPTDYQTQLEYVMKELKTTEKGAYNRLKNAKTPEEAALIVSKYYERPNAQKAGNQHRINYAKNALSVSQNNPMETKIEQAKTEYSKIDNTPAPDRLAEQIGKEKKEDLPPIIPVTIPVQTAKKEDEGSSDETKDYCIDDTVDGLFKSSASVFNNSFTNYSTGNDNGIMT